MVAIQQNTRVRVADVNVGNVTKIEVQDWHALVTMRINGDVHLPANSTAKVGTTSLLGSMHIELAPPADEPPQGELKNGSVIPLSSASTYPTTEQTLASVSILLNGGGLGQLQEINQAFAKAMAGRENDHAQPADPTGHLHRAAQRARPTTSSRPQRISTRWSVRSRRTTRPSTRRSPPSRRRWRCWRIPARSWRTPSTRSASSAPSPPTTVNQTKESFVANLRNIAPVLRELADAGPALTKGLDFLSTYPWVKSTVPNWFRGDFANITLVIDLTLSRLDAGLFTGTRWEGDLTELELQWGRTIGQMPSPYTAGNPLIAPYRWGAY